MKDHILRLNNAAFLVSFPEASYIPQFQHISGSPVKNEMVNRGCAVCTRQCGRPGVIRQRDDYILHVSRYVPKPADTSRVARKSIRRRTCHLLRNLRSTLLQRERIRLLCQSSLAELRVCSTL